MVPFLEGPGFPLPSCPDTLDNPLTWMELNMRINYVFLIARGNDSCQKLGEEIPLGSRKRIGWR